MASQAAFDIEVDVAVIGGGAAGSYAAVRLQDDLKKKIVLIEKADRLGGHVNTASLALDPSNPNQKIPVDFGVQGFIGQPGVAEFIQRFGFQTQPISPPSIASTSIDFSTGIINAAKPGPADVQAAMGKWMQLCQPYLKYMEIGYELPESGDDLKVLAKPFGEFAKENGIENIVSTLWATHNYIDLMSQPTLYVMANSGLQQFGAMMPNSSAPFVVIQGGNNSRLYEAIREKLGESVLLSSTVTAAERKEGQDSVLTVDTPAGKKTIKAKTVLMAAPPTLENLAGWDLSHEEKGVFGKWDATNFYIGVLQNSGLAQGSQLSGSTPDPENLNIPKTPFILNVMSFIPGLANVMVIGDKTFTSDAAKDMLLAGFKKVNATGALPVSAEPQIAAWASHAPSMFTVTPKEVSCGFYSRLTALQGHKGTFYAGNALTPDKTSNVWLHVDKILQDKAFQ